jgi:hypothetical protein
MGTRNSSVGIEIRLRAGRLRFNSRQRICFSSHHRVQTGSGGHLVSFSMGTSSIYPSSAEVMNEWRYTSTPPIRLHGVVLS